MANTGVQNYLNTLIFCIVAKAVTVIMLVLLFTKVGKPLAYMILTLELGMVSVIIFALVQIRKYEKARAAQYEQFLRSAAQVTTCPDYYVREADVYDESTCKNSYRTPDNKYEYIFQVPSFTIDKVFTNKMTYADACLRVTASNPTGPNFNQIAYTDLKDKCYAHVS